jgi:hypothetical protein
MALALAACSGPGGTDGNECGSSGGQGSCVGPHASSSGTITDQSGRPAGGVTVYFRPNDKSLDFATHAVSDSAGYYEDHAVPVGDISIVVDSAHRIVGGLTSLNAKDGEKLVVDLTVAPAS